jgi:ribonuclease-3
MSSSSSDEDSPELVNPPPLVKSEIDALIGVKVTNLKLYQRAFTHKSAMKKYTLGESFETLEFMGDSVLGFIITKYLFDRYEDKQEGFLTKARTKLVRGETLARIASKLDLDKWILMDDKGMRNGWNKNPKVLEDVFEALVGAIYLDLGLIHAKNFVLNIFEDPEMVDMGCLLVDDNHKDRLMRYCQGIKIDLPQYTIESHVNGIFKILAIVDGTVTGFGVAKNKKQAEQIAAQDALKHLPV